MSINLYRGFIPTNGKVPAEALKTADGAVRNDFKTEAQVTDMPGYAGVLGENTVMVDIDDPEQAKAAIRFIEENKINTIIRKTTRGIHMLFTLPDNGASVKCQSHIVSAMGYVCDYKTGADGKAAIDVIKVDGTERPVVYQRLSDAGTVDALPVYFYPTKSKANFYGLEEGDGRNDALYRHIIMLQKAGVKNDDIPDVLSATNDYVFKEALSSSELATICRSDALNSGVTADEETPDIWEISVDKNGNNHYKLDHQKFVKYLNFKLHPCLIDGHMYFWNSPRGYYSDDLKDLEAIIYTMAPSVNQNVRQEIISKLALSIQFSDPVDDEGSRYISFNDKVYDTVKKEVLPISYQYHVTSKIPHNCPKDNVYNSAVDKMLDTLTDGDKELRQLLCEFAGYCLIGCTTYKAFCVLLGPHDSGKSTFQNFLKYCIGEQNTASLDPKDLGNRFCSGIVGKKLILGPDIADGYIGGSSASMLKALTGDDAVQVERKYQDPFTYKFTGSFVMGANSMPKIADDSNDGGAVRSRMKIIPFEHRFIKGSKDNDPNVGIKLRTEGAAEYMLKLALDGLKSLQERGAFIEPARVTDLVNNWAQNNDSISCFISEGGVQIECIKCADVYAAYKTFCEDNGFKAVSSMKFRDTICKRLNFTITRTPVNGKDVVIYVAKKEGGEV